MDVVQTENLVCLYIQSIHISVDPERGGGAGGLDNCEAIGFLSNTDPDPLENYQAQCWATIGPPAKHLFAGGPIMARF